MVESEVGEFDCVTAEQVDPRRENSGPVAGNSGCPPLNGENATPEPTLNQVSQKVGGVRAVAN